MSNAPTPMPQQFSLFQDEPQHDAGDDAGETSVPGKYSNCLRFVNSASGVH
jgi:hypothetical protein